MTTVFMVVSSDSVSNRREVNTVNYVTHCHMPCDKLAHLYVLFVKIYSWHGLCCCFGRKSYLRYHARDTNRFS